MFGAAELYGAQPTPTPVAVRSAEQAAVAPRTSKPNAPQRDEGAEASGRRGIGLWVVLLGVAIALGWVGVSGAVRIGK